MNRTVKHIPVTIKYSINQNKRTKCSRVPFVTIFEKTAHLRAICISLKYLMHCSLVVQYSHKLIPDVFMCILQL